MIQDQQWSTMRILFLVFGLLSFFTLIMNPGNTILDYVRIVVTIIAVTVYMMTRDGIGEDGLVTAGKFYPWADVRGWDYEDRKNVRAIYFTVESQNEKKPDDYVTKELDFAKDDVELLMKFMNMNLSRKYTRMKKRR